MLNCNYTNKNFFYKKETFYNFGSTKNTAATRANQNQGCLRRPLFWVEVAHHTNKKPIARATNLLQHSSLASDVWYPLPLWLPQQSPSAQAGVSNTRDGFVCFGSLRTKQEKCVAKLKIKASPSSGSYPRRDTLNRWVATHSTRWETRELAGVVKQRVGYPHCLVAKHTLPKWWVPSVAPRAMPQERSSWGMVCFATKPQWGTPIVPNPEKSEAREISTRYGKNQTITWFSIKNKKKKLGSSYSKLSEVKLITIGLASPLRILQWAEKTLPNGKIYGEVLNANTLHHKTFKPMKGGLFCERIFGPLKDFECACGKVDNTGKKDLKQARMLMSLGVPSRSCSGVQEGETQSEKPSLLSLAPRKFCPECDVEYTWSVIRRYQLGYIKLISPVTHVWFLKGNPSYLSLLLDMKKRYLQYVTYGSETLTLENSLFPIKNFPTFFPSLSSVKDSGFTLNRSTTYNSNASFALPFATLGYPAEGEGYPPPVLVRRRLEQGTPALSRSEALGYPTKANPSKATPGVPTSSLRSCGEAQPQPSWVAHQPQGREMRGYPWEPQRSLALPGVPLGTTKQKANKKPPHRCGSHGTEPNTASLESRFSHARLLKNFKEHYKLNKSRKKQRLLNLMLILARLTQDKSINQEMATSLNESMQNKVSQQINSFKKQRLKQDKSLLNFLSLLNHSKEASSTFLQIDEIKKAFFIKFLCALPLCLPYVQRDIIDFDRLSQDKSSHTWLDTTSSVRLLALAFGEGYPRSQPVLHNGTGHLPWNPGNHEISKKGKRISLPVLEKYKLLVSLIMKIYKKLPLDFYILCLLEQKLQKQIYKTSSKTSWQKIYTKTYYKASLNCSFLEKDSARMSGYPSVMGFTTGTNKLERSPSLGTPAFHFVNTFGEGYPYRTPQRRHTRNQKIKNQKQENTNASFLSILPSVPTYFSRKQDGRYSIGYSNRNKRKDICKTTSQLKTIPVKLCLNLFKKVALTEGVSRTSIRLVGSKEFLHIPSRALFLVASLPPLGYPGPKPLSNLFMPLFRKTNKTNKIRKRKCGTRTVYLRFGTERNVISSRRETKIALHLFRRETLNAPLLYKFVNSKNSKELKIKKYYGIKQKQKHILFKLILQKFEKCCTPLNIQYGQNLLKNLKPYLFLHISLILQKVKQPLFSTFLTTNIELSFNEIETKINALMQQIFEMEGNIITNALLHYFLRPLIIINLFKIELNNSLSLLTLSFKKTKGHETFLCLPCIGSVPCFAFWLGVPKKCSSSPKAGVPRVSPWLGLGTPASEATLASLGFAFVGYPSASLRERAGVPSSSLWRTSASLRCSNAPSATKLGLSGHQHGRIETWSTREAKRDERCKEKNNLRFGLRWGTQPCLGTPAQASPKARGQGTQHQPKIYNNVYALSHRERWTTEKDWQIFILYNSAPQQNQDVPILAYQHRFSALTSFDLGSEGSSSYSLGLKSNVWSVEAQNTGSAALGSVMWEPHRRFAPFNRLSNAFYVGPGIIQQLLFELNFSEIKKLDKQNRFFLYNLNKYIIKLKKQAEILLYDKNTKNALKELCKKRDLLIRRTKLIRKLYRKDSDPSSMVLTLLPVLPPDLRPIVKMGDQIAASDLNLLYKRVIYRNERLKKFLKDPATSYSSEMKYAQRLLQEAVDNLIQNGKGGSSEAKGGAAEKDSRGRILKSLSDLLKGKQGRFRQFLLGKRVDYSGRSVIVVGPKLKLSECGIPFEMAKVLYLPFLMKVILKKHYARTNEGAKKLIQNNPALTQELLNEVMQASPVLLNRAPTLHRLGIQAFVPKLVEGRAILLHPLVCSAFNADFDGDQMAVHVPITVEARAEAWKLMLSRNNLLSPATGDPLAIPSQDMVLGCYYLTTYSNKGSFRNLKGSGFYFNNFNEVVNAYNNSELLAFKTVLNLHSLIWVKWANLIENGSDQTEPLEIRISPLGNWQEISTHYHRFFDSQNVMINQYITTTPGRILFNMLLQKITSN